MDKIILKGMEFHSKIGCYTEERVVGTKIIVDLTISVDCSIPALSDKIEEALNYVDIYNEIRQELKKECNLIENAAERVLDRILKKFVYISKLKIRLSKINPSIGGKIEKVSIEMKKKK